MSQVPRPGSGPGLANWARADAGQGSAGTPGAGPADRVAVVADEPLDAACHGHIVHGQSAAVPWGERNGDAITAEVDGRLATGNGSVIGHPADEPRRRTEVVEVEGLLDAVAVGFPAGQGAEELRLADGGHGGLLVLLRDCRSWPSMSKGGSLRGYHLID